MEPSPQDIREQLNRILLSQEFESSEGLAIFLQYVVEETLAGRDAQISQRSIGINGLGYPSNFNPDSNPAVRMQASRLRRALKQYYLTQGESDPLIIEIPKGRYVPAFLSNKGPSTAQESTSAGVRAPAIDAWQADALDGPSIAVLTFKHLGDQEQYIHFSTGLTEEIVIALTRFPDFLVIGPLGRDSLCEETPDARTVGRRYGVRFLLDGTVRLRGNTLRITARLAEMVNGCDLWGDAYDYELNSTSILQVEEELVGRVVGTIADNFGVIPRTLAKTVASRRNQSLSNYEAVLRFHHHNRTLTVHSMNEAVAALEEVVDRDPDNDLAIALLADFVGAPYFLGYVDDTSGLEMSETLARRALALNPRSQQAHFAMAQIHYQRLARTACLAEIEHVLELNPNNANYLAISALFLTGIGQLERGLALMHKAMTLNPHHPGWYHLIPFAYHYVKGAYERALISAVGFNTPDYFWDPLIRCAALGQLGRREQAVEAATELLTLVPDFSVRGRSLIKRILFQNEHVDTILTGLKKAGIHVKDDPRGRE